MKIGITILCTNAYFVLGIRFAKRFMHYYKGDAEIKFYLFTDRDPKDYLPDNFNYEWVHTTNKSWVDGTNLKFVSIIGLQKTCDTDYLFYFDADTNVNRDFTEEWFLGYSVGGQHYADLGWMKHEKGFDRNPRSKSYVPKDTKLPQMYFYGAFFGGTTEWMIDFCKLMRYYQLEDKKIPYEPGVNDESYINREFHYNPPTKIVKTGEFKFLISDKGGIGETRRMDLDLEDVLEQARAAKDKVFDLNGKSIKASKHDC